MKRRTALALVLLAFALAGCATSRATSSPRSTSPHVRCLADPTERGTRPLIFLFCIESP
jgi:hypothetical protein